PGSRRHPRPPTRRAPSTLPRPSARGRPACRSSLRQYNVAPMQRTSDLRIESYRPLLPPAILLEEIPLGERGSETVARGRAEVAGILRGEDDRLVVVVGPCSIHDPAAGLEYGRRLKALADTHAADPCLVMRVYF